MGKVDLNTWIKYSLDLLHLSDKLLLLNALLVIVSAMDRKYLLKESTTIFGLMYELPKAFKCWDSS
jgi:hypothetical protein